MTSYFPLLFYGFFLTLNCLHFRLKILIEDLTLRGLVMCEIGTEVTLAMDLIIIGNLMYPHVLSLFYNSYQFRNFKVEKSRQIGAMTFVP